MKKDKIFSNIRRFFTNRFVALGALSLAVAVVIASSFWWGLQVGKRTPQIVKVEGVNVAAPTGTTADFGPFWQTWKLISDIYLKNSSTSDQDKVRGATKGLVEALGDPYSQFFSPDDSKKFQEDIQGNFSGVGMQLGMDKDQIVVVSPLKDTPASRAGIRSGDRIMKINSSSTQGMALDEAVNLIRGPVNTNVEISILRDQWEQPKALTLTRANIEVPTVEYEMKDGGVAHISLFSFNANANRLFYEKMSQAAREGAKAVVLDLRDNPGGYLEVAVDLAGWFVPEGKTVVSEATRNGVEEVFKSQGNGALVNVPVVVLINKGSASASEILAGALRDIRGAKLVGEQSFGKGTVQELQQLKDGSSVKLTVAHWVLPSGQILENGGLKPDVEITLTEENIEKKQDPQLDKAVEMAKQQIR